LKPGGSYQFRISSNLSRGISDSTPVHVELPAPAIFIGEGSSGSIGQPIAFQSFAVLDSDSDGIVDGAQGSGGAFPLYASNKGANSIARPGNLFDSNRSGARVNVVVGYYFNEG
jgi:hypothetical protein